MAKAHAAGTLSARRAIRRPVCNANQLSPLANSHLTSPNPSGIKGLAAVAATRGDLGQLAPRKKLLKSFSSFPEDFLRPSEHFGTEGFSFPPPCCPNRIPCTCSSAVQCVPTTLARTDL